MAAPTRNNQANSRFTTNATSATLASYTPTSGSNRILVVRAAAMYGVQSSFTLSATFGGVSMTEAVTAVQDWTDRYLRVSIFYLINPSGSAGDIVVTASQTMNGFVVDAVTLLGAAQSSPVGATDTDSGTSTDTSSLSLAGCASESLILAAVASNCALAPTWSWSGATEDYELTGTASTAEMAGSGAYYATSSSGTVNITATRSASSLGLAAAAVEFKNSATPQTLTGAHISSTATLYAPAKINRKVIAPHISSTATLYAPTKLSKHVAPPVIASGATLYAPAKINRKIVMATIAGGAAPYAPYSVTVSGATTTLTGAHIASTAALYAPGKVNQKLNAPLIASGASLGIPTIWRGTIRLDSVTSYLLPAGVDSHSVPVEIGSDGAVAIALSYTYHGSNSIDNRPVVRFNDANLTEDTFIGAAAAINIIDQYYYDEIYCFFAPAGDAVISVLYPYGRGVTMLRIVIFLLSGVDNTRAPIASGTDALTDTLYGQLSTNSLIVGGGLQMDGDMEYEPLSGSAVVESDMLSYPAAFQIVRPVVTAATEADYGVSSSSGAPATIVGAWFSDKVPNLLPSPWSSSTALYAPARVALPGQTIDAPAMTGATALYAGRVVKGLDAPLIASTAAVRTPSGVNHKLAGATLSSGARYAPAVTPGARALAGVTISDTTIYAPALAMGGVALDGAHIAVTPTVHTPVAVVPGGVTLRGRPLDVGTRVYAPARAFNLRIVAPPLIASTAQINVPDNVVVRLYILAPFIGCETPMGINSPAMVNLMTLYAMTMLRLRIYGATISAGTMHTPAAIASGPRVQTGDVFPPVEVDTV